MIYRDIKEQLAEVAGYTGMRVDDTRLMKLVTRAQKILLSKGNWKDVLVRLTIGITEGVVTLPEEYDALYFYDGNLSYDSQVVDNWFDLHSGYVVAPAGIIDTVQDIGEVAVFRHPCGRKIKAYSEHAGTIKVIADGEEIELTPGSPTSEGEKSAKPYEKVTRVERDAPGKPFELVYEDCTDEAVETLGGRYNGSFAVPRLRAYHILETDQNLSANIVARKRVIPITGDLTPMVITNELALEHAIRSIAYNNAGKFEKGEARLMQAVRELLDENKRYHPHHIAPKVAPSQQVGVPNIR